MKEVCLPKSTHMSDFKCPLNSHVKLLLSKNTFFSCEVFLQCSTSNCSSGLSLHNTNILVMLSRNTSIIFHNY